MDLLREISKKLTTLVNGVKDLKSSLKDLKEQTVAKTVVPAPDESNGQIGETLEQIRNYLERLSEPQHEPVVTQESTTTGILNEEEALRLKSRISDIWDNNLKSRRLAYWQSYRNQNIADKYTEWSELDTVILPKWLQIRKKHENKNPYIKIGHENDGAKTYAEVVSNSTQRPPQPCPNNLEGRQEPPTNLRAESERKKH